MNTPSLDPARLPAPLSGETFRLLRNGIYDDDCANVFINTAGDFAAVDPLPKTEYQEYKSRAESLGLTTYKTQRASLQDRLTKITPHLAGAPSFLEVGAADGAFLSMLRDQDPARRYAAVEPDTRTHPARDALGWLEQFDSIAAAAENPVACIGMFHVFEHIVDPQPMLTDIRQALAPGGQLIIEVPCLLDPLLSVFDSRAYADFYFQRQHPYVYTGASLVRVLTAAGFAAIEQVPYQRYGLENHLNWLRTHEPGGDADYRALFLDIDGGYRQSLEAGGTTDTVIVIARVTQ